MKPAPNVPEHHTYEGLRDVRRRAIEIAVFAALAWFVAAHWAHALVANAPAGRVFACVVIAVSVAVAVTLVDRVPAPWGALMRLAAVVSGVGAGFVAIGLERRFLAPAHWDELGDGLDRGFAALGSGEWPYHGSEPWAALVLLLAIPLVLAIAAALASWPNRALRPFALVLLVAMYGLAVTEHEFTGEPGRGAALLLLVAAWLWLPRMPERGGQAAIAAAGAVLAACFVALPAAAGYDDRRHWIDYKSWNPFEAQAASRFNWSHSYGPIDWPREGTTLMNVRSDERHYWKAETLDLFDGLRWRRSGLGRNSRPLLPQPFREEWETEFEVTIRDLDTDLFPIAGTALSIDADPVAVYSDEGTVEAAGESLEEGDTYSVHAYVPDPTPAEMRSAPDYVDPRIHDRYTGIMLLPGISDFATDREIDASPYWRVQRLARRLAAGQNTTYDIVRAVHRHLRSAYIYTERPPEREYPLAAFLFRDRVGYCQQFSGAMALMLRMLDIPARVAGGFTPGSYNTDTKEYRVRDLDAHSWVEVWFNGIGWVPFDPTPSIAPANSQSSAEAASASGGDSGAGEVADPPRVGAVPPGTGGADDGADEDAGITAWLALAALVLAGAVVAGVMRVRGAATRGDRRSQEEADIGALVRALSGVGERVPPRATLRQLESRLERTAGASAARYVLMLREHRFSPAGGARPDAAARRDLRRALVRGRGPRARLAALLALPPVAFRRG